MYRIGIDLGGTKTEGIVIDRNGRLCERERVATPRVQGYRAIVDMLTDLVARLERRCGHRCTVGIGTPGSPSAIDGRMRNCNTTCLNGRALQADLEQRLDRPVRLANDANCFALAEALDGAGAGHATVFGVILGTGVGGGIVVHGRLLTGHEHIAGEWGHNPLEDAGPACYCGRRGCVETLLSGPGLCADHARNGGEHGLEPPAIVSHALDGDPVAATTLTRYLERFGRALATVINILDPDAIVLGGGLSNIELLYSRGREAIAPHVFSDRFTTPLLRNRLGDSAGVFGAARLWPAVPDDGSA